ncbi:MAG TPA: DNA gyrase inhibitor YacG [Myxococcaceae bacterium]|nr:DNA gyrase inhibitor YacG [Myxococcaceae bacterium]
MQRITHCPVCKKPAERRGRNPAFPFCSQRCRRIDLGRWFGEEYRVPSTTAEGDEQPPSADDPKER